MDPVTVVGLVAASVQISHFIGITIQGLNTLKGKFNDADITIRLLIGQLSTIKAAILQIRDWAKYNFDDSPKEQRFLIGLNVALDGCQAAMDVLSEEVNDLIAGIENSQGDALASLGTRVRIRVAWNESNMKAHQDRLYGQVQALQLLLLAGQCRDAMSQVQLMGLKENQKLLQKVADDTKTLRESHSSIASQTSLGTRPFGGTIFDFDERLEETLPYQAAAMRNNPIPNAMSLRNIVRKPVGSPTPRNDEGYETGTPRTEPASPDLSRKLSTSFTVDIRPFQSNRNALPDVSIFRSNSVSSTPVFEPAVRRWLSSSSSTDSPPPEDRPTDIHKKKFWQSGLARLNTFNASRSRLAGERVHSANASFESGQRWRRGVDFNKYQSIDFTSVDGLETPALIRVAQAGNIIEIERLLENGDEIEARHTSTQRTALAVAAHCGSVGLVGVLIQHRAKYDTRDRDQATPLHLAASRGHCGVISRLLDVDVDVEATDKDNQTPLWIAADQGQLKAVEILLKRGAKVNARANNQLTALHAAAQHGDLEMIELLIRHNAHIEARDSQFMTALHYACEAGHSVVAELLIHKGAKIEARGKNSMSPFICAAAAGHVHILDLLLKKKASSRSLDDTRANSLHWAARNGHLETAEFLIASKLSVIETDVNGLAPLHLAVLGSHFSIVDYLIQKNAAVEIPCKKGWTPLHYACSSYNPDIVRLLLGAGAHPEGRVSSDGRRPVHVAASSGSAEIIEILHQKGVDIGCRDSAGDRPLCIACNHGHVEVVRALLSCGEPLRKRFSNRPNEDSPLCIAARAGHLDIVRLLIRKGASVKQRDEYGFIPLRYAAFYGHPDVLRLLLEEGAELVDDGEDSNGWGFILTPDMIGFSDSSNITDERKLLVRELLEEAQTNMHWRNRDGNRTHFEVDRLPEFEGSSARHMLGNSPRPELAGWVSRSVGQPQGGSSLPRSNLPTESPPAYSDSKVQDLAQETRNQSQQQLYPQSNIVSELDARSNREGPVGLGVRRALQGPGIGRMRMMTTRTVDNRNRATSLSVAPSSPPLYGTAAHDIASPYEPSPYEPSPYEPSPYGNSPYGSLAYVPMPLEHSRFVPTPLEHSSFVPEPPAGREVPRRIADIRAEMARLQQLLLSEPAVVPSNAATLHTSHESIYEMD